MKYFKKPIYQLGLMLIASVLFASNAQAVFFHIGSGSIDGSLCVGNDCASSEVFSFDTIRVKENNLRIHFDDTSVAASFPSNDWRLVANDTVNGGLSHFTIQDATGGNNVFKVEAGARNNALYVESDGDVGIGTPNPAVDLEIVTGNTPTVRLRQDGSSGFTPQTWDMAGNETNFFIRDVTNGSKLPFRIRPDAPTNSINIAANGDVGMGTASPEENLDIKGGNSDTVAFQLSNDSSWRVRNQGTAGATDGWLEFRSDDGTARIPMRISAEANNNLLLVGAANASTADSDRVTITGELFINGVDNSAPDYVFEPDYELKSIDDHADAMWENKHLPAVGAGQKSINVTNLAYGVLEELEVAHIYIEQLNEKVKQLTQEKNDAIAAIAAVKERLSRLENK